MFNVSPLTVFQVWVSLRIVGYNKLIQCTIRRVPKMIQLLCKHNNVHKPRS